MSRQQDKDSAKGSPEDTIENETCTGDEDCQECERLEKLSDDDCDCKDNPELITNPEIVMFPDPEILAENLVEEKHRILESAKQRRLASIRSGPSDLTPNATTRDQLTAGASSSASDTDTMKKAGLKSKEDKSPSSETGLNSKEHKSPSSSETGLNSKVDKSPSSETGLNSKEDASPSSSETGLNYKEDWFKCQSSSESSTEKIEIKACTQKDCEECEKIRVASAGHNFEVLHTPPELCLEASEKDDFLHVKVKDGTKDGASSSESDTDTMEKGTTDVCEVLLSSEITGLNSEKEESPSTSEAGLNSKEDKSSSSESEGFELLENEDV